MSSNWNSDWTGREKHAYRLGIQKGRQLAAQESDEGQERELPTLLDRFAMAALANIADRRQTASYFQIATEAYDIANAMMAMRQKRSEINDEIPF